MFCFFSTLHCHKEMTILDPDKGYFLATLDEATVSLREKYLGRTPHTSEKQFTTDGAMFVSETWKY